MQHEVPFEPEAVLHELYSLEQIVSSIAAGSWAGGGGGGDAQLPARFSADDAAAGPQEWHDQSGALKSLPSSCLGHRLGLGVFPEEGAAVPALVCRMTRGIGGGRCVRLQLVFFRWLAHRTHSCPEHFLHSCRQRGVERRGGWTGQPHPQATGTYIPEQPARPAAHIRRRRQCAAPQRRWGWRGRRRGWFGGAGQQRQPVSGRQRAATMTWLQHASVCLCFPVRCLLPHQFSVTTQGVCQNNRWQGAG